MATGQRFPSVDHVMWRNNLEELPQAVGSSSESLLQASTPSFRQRAKSYALAVESYTLPSSVETNTCNSRYVKYLSHVFHGKAIITTKSSIKQLVWDVAHVRVVHSCTVSFATSYELSRESCPPPKHIVIIGQHYCLRWKLSVHPACTAATGEISLAGLAVSTYVPKLRKGSTRVPCTGGHGSVTWVWVPQQTIIMRQQSSPTCAKEVEHV